MPGKPVSIRMHVLAIVLVGAILPLALIGLWLTQSAQRSGRALLDEQLATSLANTRRIIQENWEFRRGDVLLLAGNQVARDMLARGTVTRSDSQFLERAANAMGRGIPAFTYRDIRGREVYVSPSPNAPRAQNGANGNARTRMTRRYSVGLPNAVVGTVEAQLYLDGIVPSDSARLSVPGSALAIRDRENRSVILPFSRTVDFPATSALTVDDAEWTVKFASLEDPAFDFAVLGPIGPYTSPFARDAQYGFMALLAVIGLATLLTGFFTARLSRSIGSLADTAGVVASGNLDVRAEVRGPSEFQRLSKSFNEMTDSLRRVLGELSERRALAAVGEFAAELAHEVRNALTSVQIDLDRVGERIEDTKSRELVSRSLAHVRRLDAAVTGSLRIARSGRIEPKNVRLHEVVREAMRVAVHSFTATGTRLTDHSVAQDVIVRGDADALHQLFLNLLLNAQQALPTNGEAVVSVVVHNGAVMVSIADTGPGMTAEQVELAFKPYHTSRPNGTGLGLPIARQIAIAHGGDLTICSVPGGGTTVEITLPVA